MSTVGAGHRADKRLGQNFLHDAGVLGRIVRAIAPAADDHIVEIGPGLGALSAPLLDSGARLDLIELDARLLEPLAETLSAPQPRLTIHHVDALRCDLRQLHAAAGGTSALRLVGNLPYNISTPLLFHVLSFSDIVRDMHFMLQKEVVSRICAPPGGKDYGRLTVALAARADVRWLFDVGPGAFRPAPKVTSAVVRIVPRPPSVPLDDGPTLDALLRAGFSQRRKTLGNALSALASRELICAADIDPMARAETLSPARWIHLANMLHRQQRDD